MYSGILECSILYIFVRFNCFIVLYIFILPCFIVYYIIKSEILKSPSVIVDLYISLLNFVNYCLYVLGALLLRTCVFILAIYS